MTGSIGGLDLRSTTTGRVSNPPLPSHSFVTLQYYGVEPLGSVVKDGLLISYGPPILEPDLLLLFFQGGGADQVVQKEWPKKLLYVDSPHKFGKKLRKLCRATGLYTSLETSTVAFPTVFPQGPSKEADCWEKGSGLYSVWRHHSVDWVERLVKSINPKVVIVFGDRASRVFGIRWEKIERFHSQKHQTFGESTFHGAPAVFCHHLSQSCPKPEALKCFEHAKRLISQRS